MKLRNKKTGEIIIPTYYTFSAYGDGIRYGHHIYYSLAELNEDWEDYDPKEPLIKDEKIRKLVRAWAEYNSIEKVLYLEMPERVLCRLEDTDDSDYEIDFVGHIPTLEDGEDYTIAELCGEGKE